MKKSILFTLIFACCFSFSSNATHLMGGDITLYNDSNADYTLTLQLYRDIQGIPLYSVDMVDMFTYDVVSGQFLFDSTLNIPQNMALSTALVPLFPYGVEVGVYTQALLSLPAGQYKFVYYTCCRNGAIANITSPLTDSMVLYTTLTVPGTGANSTPACIAMPIAYFPINLTANYNPLPYDPDADSIAWALNTPYGTYTYTSTTSPVFSAVGGFTAPPASSTGPFTMNAVTGEITWTPNTLGNFVQSFEIDEYRNGVQIGNIIRDMQYVVVSDSTADSLSMISAMPCFYDTVHEYNYMYYTPGQPFTFQVNGGCSDPNIPLNMNAFGTVFKMTNPATFSVAGTNSALAGTMNWTPPTSFTKDVIVVFRIQGGMFTKDYTLLLRKAPVASSVASTGVAQAVVHAYPNPAHKTLNVSLDMTQDITADISIYSVLGKNVANIYSGSITKGHHEVKNQMDLAAGVYFLVVKDKGQVINTQHIVVE